MGPVMIVRKLVGVRLGDTKAQHFLLTSGYKSFALTALAY